MKAYKTPDYRMSDHPVIEYLKMLEEESEDEQVVGCSALTEDELWSLLGGKPEKKVRLEFVPTGRTVLDVLKDQAEAGFNNSLADLHNKPLQ